MELGIDKKIKDIFTRCISLMVSKNDEYTNGADFFHNFDKASEMSGKTREQVLKMYKLKHDVSIDDMIEKPMCYDDKIIEEKITDAINYLVILEMMLKDRNEIYEELPDGGIAL